MTPVRLVPSRLTPWRASSPALAGFAALLAFLMPAAPAAAQTSPHFHRGHLPAIGEIKLLKTKGGRVEITVPVSFTKALSGDATGLESAEVTLQIGHRGRHGSVLDTFTRTHRHGIGGTDTILDRFRLDRRMSLSLLHRPDKERGQLVRVDVRHRIKERRGEPPLHEKDASLTMASSHRARPQGEDAALTVRNDTPEPVRLASEPVLCMYTNGEGGSNLQAFTTPEGEPLRPGGTIEAKVEGSASALFSGEDQRGTGRGAGYWYDWEGQALDALQDAAELELTPFLLGLDLTQNCDAQASTFMLVAADQSGQAATAGAWVLTHETCRIGCVDNHMPSAVEAGEVQGIGEEEVNPGVWGDASTEALKALVGGWHEPPAGGKVVQDQGLQWDRQETAKVEEEEMWELGGEFVTVPVLTRGWELSIHAGSNAAGHSG